MLGLICYRCGKEKNGRRTLCGARFRAAYVERGEGLRARLSARRAARYLAKRHVRRAVFPAGYPYEECFARAGVLPVEEMPLRMAKAAEIVRCAMKELAIRPESARVALLAAARSDVLERTAAELSRSVRHLLLCAPESGRLARALRWDSGASVGTAERGAAIGADLAVSFDASVPRCRVPLLMLTGRELRVEYGVSQETEELVQWEQRQLLPALFSSGCLRGERIRVKAVKFPLKTGENTNLP